MIEIDQKLAELGLRFAAFEAEGPLSTPLSKADREAWNARQDALLDRFETNPPPAAIKALHGVFAALGIGLRQGRPSVERFRSGMLKGRRLPEINTVVDLYNLESIEHMMCMGAHDLDIIAAPVALRLTRGDESFTPLGGKPEPVRQGEFAYVDSQNRVICRLDAVQADFSKVTDQTRRALFIIEGHPAASEDEVRKAVEAVAHALTSTTGCKCGPVVFAPTVNFDQGD